MASNWGTIKAFFKLTAKDTLVYRGMLIVWLVGWGLFFLMMVFVWQSAGRENIGGFSLNQLITYYFVGLFVQAVCGWTPFYEINSMIKDGGIVKFITKPINFYWFSFGSGAGWHTVNTGFYLIFLGFVYLFVNKYIIIGLSFFSLVLFIISLAIAIMVTWEFNLVMSTTAFWLTEAEQLASLYWIALILFGGQSVPLSFFPPTARQIVSFLPFRYMYSLPIEIYLGKLSLKELLTAFGISLIWIYVLYRLFHYLWNKGLKQYTSFGQ